METHDDDDGIDPVPNIDTPGCTVAIVFIAAAAAIGATVTSYVVLWLTR
jgi:hypothetical protein